MTDVIVTAVFRPRLGAKGLLIAALREGIPSVHAESGCVLYAIHDAEDGTVMMIEKWASKADLDAHSHGDAVKRLQQLTGEHLDGPATVTLMSPLPAGTDQQGVL